MEARELRIGNYVNRNGIVVKSDFMSACNCYSVSEQYKPIPISQEWLDKLGFENGWKGNLYYNLGQKWLLYKNVIIHPDQCKYVHQLQNLYFALTGNELTIKQTDK